MQRLARWLLFAATAIGLIAMHSLGHGGGPDVTAAGSEMHTVSGPVMVAVEPVDDCAGDGCAHAAGGHHGGHGMAGWSVCQAIVEVVGLLLLTGLLLLAGAPRTPSPPSEQRARAIPRGPPLPAIGLTLSTASVLRI